MVIGEDGRINDRTIEARGALPIVGRQFSYHPAATSVRATNGFARVAFNDLAVVTGTFIAGGVFVAGAEAESGVVMAGYQQKKAKRDGLEIAWYLIDTNGEKFSAQRIGTTPLMSNVEVDFSNGHSYIVGSRAGAVHIFRDFYEFWLSEGGTGDVIWRLAFSANHDNAALAWVEGQRRLRVAVFDGAGQASVSEAHVEPVTAGPDVVVSEIGTIVAWLERDPSRESASFRIATVNGQELTRHDELVNFPDNVSRGSPLIRRRSHIVGNPRLSLDGSVLTVAACMLADDDYLMTHPAMASYTVRLAQTLD